jgi:membrane peptidoglycan carboxypeptidase
MGPPCPVPGASIPEDSHLHWISFRGLVRTTAAAGLPDGNRALDPIIVSKVTNRRGETLLDNETPQYDYVIDPEYAYMITDILSNDANRAITYGRGSNLNIPGHRVAVKTGTSEPYETNRLIGDTWTIGYTPDVAVGVWVGNSDNTPMVNIFSTTIAGRTWHDSMLAALEGRPARDWVKPSGLEEATVCVPSGKRLVPGMRCAQTVRGIFATKALDQDQAHWWGGRTVGNGSDPNVIPPEFTGVQRSLAEEYMRRLAPPPERKSPTPTAPAPVSPLAPVVPNNSGPGGGGGGNGNGGGRGR